MKRLEITAHAYCDDLVRVVESVRNDEAGVGYLLPLYRKSRGADDRPTVRIKIEVVGGAR